ncbi:hypothetical protein SNE35_24645 [Paucibacter sp. R3-3]|uniref:Quinol:cytochrome C oxidoreductase n=1 Tax=Roseateles agri TaxID=3098619 RepID=A0ABU5DN09_9BURK|nr:hypothetical protein [Paucibacter sp. R3-3]MDY0747715.1 hypothetical protein [Paucibacter sp. R3-3]
MNPLGLLLLLLLFAVGWWLDRPLMAASWLGAWWFCSGLVLGAAALARIHRFTGGTWGEVLRPAIWRLGTAMPRLLLLFLPLLALLHALYPWLRQPPAGGFAKAWFAPAFVALRFAAYGIGCWWLARAPMRDSDGSGRAALWLLAWMLGGTLASADLLMSLVPGWASTVFGWLALVGQMTGGMAAAVLLTARRTTRAPWRDLGNLLLMFVLLQAYLQYMQFLIIWAENLPHEIAWFLPRLQSGWRWGGLALIVGQFALPLLALLWRINKDRPWRLAMIAAGLLAMQAFGTAWLVIPSVQAQGYAAWWMLPLAFGGMGFAAFGPARAWRRVTREAARGRS